MKRFYRWLALIGGLLLIVFIVRECRSGGAATYQTATVTRGPITQAGTATGTLNPVVNVQVGSQVSGNIAKLFADFNSEVKAGQTVAQIDPMLFQAAVTQAEGDLASTQAALELAKVNATRTEQLFKQKISSQQDLDQAMAILHQAEANVKIKQGALDKAKADLDHCTITSPIDGVVISRSVDVGQTVAASLQAPVIFQIANDLTKMQIDSNVAEADVGVVQVGQDVDFTVDAFPTQTFHGKVVQVRNAPITVQNVVTYDTVIGVSNPDLKLKPGMTANVSIIAARKDNVLQIKNAALRYRPTEAGATEMGSRSPSSRGGRGSSGRERTTSEHKVYNTGEMEVPAVRGVSLEIKQGEFVALMGASGSGKSTLMNILGCLDRPSSGQYFLDDADVSGLDRDQLAEVRNRKLGFVFQSFNLLSRTSARENAELPLIYSAHHLSHAQLREKADRVLESVGLAGREDHFPSQLSGGQQQRVAIARALINEPEILLADEPTGNLDSQTTVEIMAIFQQLNEHGITIIMVTHEQDIAAYAKRNVMMRDGLIVDDHAVSERANAAAQLQQGIPSTV